jgi:integrase
MLYQRGKEKTWWYRFRFGGRIVHESAKTTSKTVARDAERARRRQFENTWNHIAKRTLPPRFDQAATAWLAEVKPHLAERTKDIYGVALDCHLVPELGSLLLCDISAEVIARYQAKRKVESASARTLNKELQVLRQILKRHKMWANLQGDVKFERESEGIGKALSREDETSLLAGCESNQLLHTVVTLAVNTALRKNEIRTLQWSQIDFFRKELVVGKSKTEGSSGRLLPLNPLAFASLIKWAGRFPESKPEHYVFPACEAAGIEREHPDMERVDPSKPIKSWRSAWRAALKRTGLKLRFHDLRHTCITKVAETTASDQTIMAIAGHVSHKMMEHYSHIRMEAKRVALDAIAKAPNPAIIQAGVHQNGNQVPEGEKLGVANSMN